MWRGWKPLASFGALSSEGVLGMNMRNVAYISRYNQRSLYPLVDDKLRTKQLAVRHDVTTPELIGVVERQHQARNLAEIVDGAAGFCVKPAKGSGGKGILVVRRDESGALRRTNGQALTARELERHVSNVLAGLFSLSGAPDVAVIEGLIEIDDAFAEYSYEGVPDVRVIVFRGIPVMAMMRLSTAASHGKANLHQGAVGVGIDMVDGRAIRAVQRNRPVELHPDTEQNLFDLRIPQWRELLALACRCADMTGLGYLGVDIVLDRARGPMLLELNARPGLAIQLANGAGLLPRLRRVEACRFPEAMALAERVAFAQQHFGVRTPPESVSLARTA